MIRKIRNDKCIINLFLVSMILLMFLILSFFHINSEYWFMEVFLITFLQLICNVFFLYKRKKIIFSFSIIFIVISYIFHYSHLILKGFNFTFGNNYVDPLIYISMDTYFLSVVFIFLVQLAVTFGCLLAYHCIKSKSGNDDIKIKKLQFMDSINDTEHLKWVSCILILIGIIPMLVIDITKLILFFNGDYGSTYAISFPHFFQLIGQLFNFGAIGLLIYYSLKNKKSALIWFVAVIVYKIIIMMSGNRAEAMIFIITFVLVRMYFSNFRNIKTMIIFAIASYAIVILLYYIATYRMDGFGIDSFIAFIKSMGLLNPLTGMLSEFGSTLTSVCFAIHSFPSITPYTFGMNYILPIILILPNLGAISSLASNYMFFPYQFETFGLGSFGGSYIGELFYAFGWFGIFFAVFVGMLIGIISIKINDFFLRKKWGYFFIIFNLTPLLYLWVRAYFGSMYRYVFWQYLIVIIVIYFVFKNIDKLKNLKKLRKDSI